MDLKDVIALGLGLVGTVLGIVNFVRSVMLDRVKLIVIPKFSWEIRGGRLSHGDIEQARSIAKTHGMPTLAFELVNRSKFPIVVDEVGFTIGRTVHPKRGVLYPLMPPGTSWPARINSRESLTVLCGPDALVTGDFTLQSRAFAMTACGITAYGSSKLLSHWSIEQKRILEELGRS